jgi:uncharacterized membrane protein
VTLFHRYLGAVIVVLFVVLFVWGLVLRIARRDDAPAGIWGVQHWTENLLVVQTVTGIVLLLMGRRVVAEHDPVIWLHYFYGSLFPLIAVVGGRIAGLRREHREYMGITWGAFFALGLTLRALQTGCVRFGEDLAGLARCLTA